MIAHGSRQRQRGVAMITALMITAIAVVVATSIFVKQRYSIRLTGNFQDLEQAYQYAYAAEDMVASWLKRDLQENQYDSQHDFWAQKDLPPFEIDDDEGREIGQLISKVEDMQGYLNLNNLLVKPLQAPVQRGSEGGSSINPDAQELNTPHDAMMNIFGRLFQSVGIPAEFRFSVLDWIDPNDQVADSSSAESADYLNLEIPYRAANSLLNHPDELMKVYMGGVEDEERKAELLDDLKPYVTALPTPTLVNINTAPKEVLSVIGLTSNQVDMIDNMRQTAPITDKAQLLQTITGLDQQATAALGVESSYFRLSGEVRLGKSRLYLNSLLFRSPQGEVRVIMRQFTRVAKPKPKTENPDLTG